MFQACCLMQWSRKLLLDGIMELLLSNRSIKFTTCSCFPILSCTQGNIYTMQWIVIKRILTYAPVKLHTIKNRLVMNSNDLILKAVKPKLYKNFSSKILICLLKFPIIDFLANSSKEWRRGSLLCKEWS